MRARASTKIIKGIFSIQDHNFQFRIVIEGTKDANKAIGAFILRKLQYKGGLVTVKMEDHI